MAISGIQISMAHKERSDFVEFLENLNHKFSEINIYVSYTSCINICHICLIYTPIHTYIHIYVIHTHICDCFYLKDDRVQKVFCILFSSDGENRYGVTRLKSKSWNSILEGKVRRLELHPCLPHGHGSSFVAFPNVLARGWICRSIPRAQTDPQLWHAGGTSSGLVY